MPGVPGLWTEQQAAGWKKVVDGVHAKGGYIYCQLWHAGRVTLPQMTGYPPVSASASAWDSPTEVFPYPPVGSAEQIPLAAHPPIELTIPHIKQTIQDYCKAAETAMKIGFDGVELHGGNGYLPEQFLSSNINKRTDEYGGTPEKRCRFVLELMDELANTIGEENLSIRLSPFGLFNQTRGEQRLETWTYLCEQLKQTHPTLSYVSFIEPVSPLSLPEATNLTQKTALRTNLQLRRKRLLPRELGSDGRGSKPIPKNLRLHAILLRRWLEPDKLMGRAGRWAV